MVNCISFEGVASRPDQNWTMAGNRGRIGGAAGSPRGPLTAGPHVFSPTESARRALSRASGRLHSLPVLALTVHSACNCRCVMCDIWKANAQKRELTDRDLEPHLDAFRRLRVRRVLLTGGEPLMHSNLWTLARMLKLEGIRLTLITTGLLLASEAENVARFCDDVVVSIDGSRTVHDAVRRTPGGFDRIAAGIAAVKQMHRRLPIVARCVIQKMNYADLPNIVTAARELGIDGVSFLAADVSSQAFNRPVPWDEPRQQLVALDRVDLQPFAEAIEKTILERDADFRSGFVMEDPSRLWRLHQYYAARLGIGDFPRIRCNAPWVSAVVDADGAVRPCFFHQPFGHLDGDRPIDQVLNSDRAVNFRRHLDVATDETCSRCVCTLNLSYRASP